jgi:hypothetical protein
MVPAKHAKDPKEEGVQEAGFFAHSVWPISRPFAYFAGNPNRFRIKVFR